MIAAARSVTTSQVRWSVAGLVVTGALAAVFLSFGNTRRGAEADLTSLPSMDSAEPIQPIEPIRNLDPKKIALGQSLFQDPRLSHDNRISCASCHNLEFGGADDKSHSIGLNGAVGIINAPTVFNSAFNFLQFWDGRVSTLELQVDGPVQSKIEMGSTWPEVIAKLERSPDYVRSFSLAYGDRIRVENVRDSIAIFERSLSTPNSRFDRFLEGDRHALTIQEQQGYALFKSYGCVNCHQGMNVGGNMFQKLGVMALYYANSRKISRADRGRFNVTGDPGDMYMFKVPSLRNVELTSPYFHDGSAATLVDSVRTMARYQLSHPLRHDESEAIVQFLKTLTGKRNGQPI